MGEALAAKWSPPDGFSRNPVRSRTLPGSYYFDPEIFAREKRQIFYNTWQYVGHSSMLPTPGSYIVRTILDQSVVVLRDRENEVHAFFNVCQHRAHQLLQGEGHLRAVLITCPYHAWTYDLTGKLRSARGLKGWQISSGTPLALLRYVSAHSSDSYL